MNHHNQISNLLFEYTHRFDSGDFASAAELFKHAEIITGKNGETINSNQLLGIWQSMVMTCEKTGSPQTKHICSNAIIEIDEQNNTASAKSYYVVYQQTETLPLQAIAAGRYHDKFECIDNLWHFCERDYRMLEMTGDTSQHLRDYNKAETKKTKD